ncbi:MAG TPA: ester cyclase [Mycobacteriales bacterium]|nr:ester cyclase [Mycobacteriales bacterium]
MSATDVLERLREAINGGTLVIDEFTEHERFRQSLGVLVTVFPDVQLDIQWIIGDGRRAAGWSTIRGTHQGEFFGIAPTGNAVEYTGLLAVEVDDEDRVVDFWVLNDFLTLLGQLGAELVPPTA